MLSFTVFDNILNFAERAQVEICRRVTSVLLTTANVIVSCDTKKSFVRLIFRSEIDMGLLVATKNILGCTQRHLLKTCPVLQLR